MNLYVLRHASAGTRRANPAVDVKRPLDKEGKQQCILVGTFLNSLKIPFDHIISSPLKRSQQTASFVGTEVGYEAEIVISEALAPGAKLRDFKHLIDSLNGDENVLLVGHNPSISAFLGSLISNGKPNLRMRKGAIARVDYTRRPGTLQWLVEPRILRNIYGKVTSKSRRKTSRK
jgi:phosphohistidine phosphatase